MRRGEPLARDPAPPGARLGQRRILVPALREPSHFSCLVPGRGRDCCPPPRGRVSNRRQVGSLFVRHVLRARPAAAGIFPGAGSTRDPAGGVAVTLRLLRQEFDVSTTRTILLVVLVAAAILLIWGFTRKAAPVELPFARVSRGPV